MNGGSDFVDVSILLGPGIYALGYAGEVVYVGQAKQLLKRLYSHRNVWMNSKRGKRTVIGGRELRVIPFSQVSVLPCHASDLDRLEKQWIAAWLPKYNTNHIPANKKVNLTGFSLTVGGIMLNFGAPQMVAGTEAVRRI